MAIKTWNTFLDKQLIKDNSTIWFFDSPKSLPKNASEWNRAIIINWTTWEYQSWERKDLGVFILPRWEQWVPWVDWATWLNWKNWINWLNWKNWNDWLQWPIGSIWMQWAKWDQWLTWRDWIQGIEWKAWLNWKNGIDWKNWLQWIKWDKWDKWDAWIAPTTEEIVAKLLMNESFMNKCKIAWPKWENWVSPHIKDIIFDLTHDADFVTQCKIKWDKWDSFTFNDLTAEQISSLKGPKWEWTPGHMWPKWLDWNMVFIQYSPDGKNNFSYRFKEWDKFISIQSGNQESNIFQIIF